MRSDDLVPILVPELPRTCTLSQGVIGSWNSTTGANSLSVGNAGYDDMPIIGGANLSDISPGDQVIVISYGNQRFILGRLIQP